MTKDKMRQVFSKYREYLHTYNGFQAQVTPKELPPDLYDKPFEDEYVLLCHLAWMCQRCLTSLIENEPLKAHVWLGYVQGELRAGRHFAITSLRDHNRESKVEVGPYGKVPRRFRIRLAEGKKHPINENAKWFYGCYFPQTDLIIGEGGVRGTGLPTEKSNPGLEWLDEPANE